MRVYKLNDLCVGIHKKYGYWLIVYAVGKMYTEVRFNKYNKLKVIYLLKKCRADNENPNEPDDLYYNIKDLVNWIEESK